MDGASGVHGGVMRALHVIGRTIFGGFFLYNGINHLQNSKGMAQHAGAKGVPAAEQPVKATGAMLIDGGSAEATLGGRREPSVERAFDKARMPRIVPVVLLAFIVQPAPPPDTEIFLATLSLQATPAVGRPANITRSPGYDNQPSFTPDGAAIFFTSN